MKSKKTGNIYFIKIDKGEEIVAVLKKFCLDNKITLGSINGLGAAETVVIGFFDTKNKEYHRKEYKEGYEIVSLSGNISEMNNLPYLHIHVVLADKNYNCFGGHLDSAIVSATFEGIIVSADGKIDRKLDKGIGINLMDL